MNNLKYDLFFYFYFFFGGGIYINFFIHIAFFSFSKKNNFSDIYLSQNLGKGLFDMIMAFH